MSKIPYSIIRPDLDTFDRVLFHGKGFFSFIISLFSWKYTHIGMVVKCSESLFGKFLQSHHVSASLKDWGQWLRVLCEKGCPLSDRHDGVLMIFESTIEDCSHCNGTGKIYTDIEDISRCACELRVEFTYHVCPHCKGSGKIKGVQLNLLSDRIANYKGSVSFRRFLGDRTESNLKQCYDFISKTLGLPYEKHPLELLGAAIKIGAKQPDESDYFCEELIDKLYQLCDFMLLDPPANKYMPDDNIEGRLVDKNLIPPARLDVEIRVK